MIPYGKTENVWHRDPGTRRLIEGAWRESEVEYLAANTWILTEKVDGTNIRVIYDPAHGGEPYMSCRGRSDKAEMHGGLALHLTATYPLEKMQEAFPDAVAPVCIYGEGYGAGIQKGGRYIADGVSFIPFDVRVGDMWLERESLVEICEGLGVAPVPVVGLGSLWAAINMMRKGPPTSLVAEDKTLPMEGFVCRPSVTLLKRRGGRVAVKVKACDFPAET